MNIKLIDQILNVAIASLIYGSEMWFVCAFSLYAVDRSRKAKATSVRTDLSDLSKQKISKQKTGDIQISITPSAKAEPVVVVPSQKVVPETTPEQSIFNLSSKTPVKPAKVTGNRAALQAIACEPVNWKKWKVGDLRKADIAKVCGVRSRPIGSRRALTKADLIAQYEQNLKRLTKSPPKQIVDQNMTA